MAKPCFKFFFFGFFLYMEILNKPFLIDFVIFVCRPLLPDDCQLHSRLTRASEMNHYSSFYLQVKFHTDCCVKASMTTLVPFFSCQKLLLNNS